MHFASYELMNYVSTDTNLIICIISNSKMLNNSTYF